MSMKQSHSANKHFHFLVKLKNLEKCLHVIFKQKTARQQVAQMCAHVYMSSYAQLHKEKKTFNSSCIWVIGNEDLIFLNKKCLSFPNISAIKFIQREKGCLVSVEEVRSGRKKGSDWKSGDLGSSHNLSYMDLNKSAF